MSSAYGTAVWSWDGAHRVVVSILEILPHRALISWQTNGALRSKEVPWEHLYRRDTGKQLTYNELAAGRPA